jgi:hypothetical protein
MLKLKDSVTGFVYESQHGYVKSIITQPISGPIVAGEDDIFVDNENVNNLFEITSQEQLQQSDEGLNKVLVWVNI